MDVGIGLPNMLPDVEGTEHADSCLRHYYGWLGDMAGQMAASAAVSQEMIARYTAAFREAGCDELIFAPATSRPDQIDLLADAIR